jgi:hypothetical protein
MQTEATLNALPAHSSPADANGVEERARAKGIIAYKDPNLVDLLRRASRERMVIYGFLFISICMNVYQFWRSPELITAVVTESGKRVVSMNNRQYGETEAVQLGPDRLSHEDKRYLVNECAKALYGIDQASRGKDIERALKMMTDDFAVKYANWLKANGNLEQQRREAWQAVWTVQESKIDQNDPYTLHVIGEQLITKNVNGQIKQERVQHALDFKVITDLPRSDRNLRTGFLIAFFGGKEIQRNAVEPQDMATQ